MEIHRQSLLAILILMFSTWLMGCSDDDNPNGPDNDYDFAQILHDFSQHVALATDADMKAKSQILFEAIQAFANNPSDQSKLEAAGQAWKTMRTPWECSEAFLFGPAEFLSIDPALDSWPVDRQQLDDVLSSNFTLTPEFIADGLGSALRGFHTIEYLLFRDGTVRSVAEVTERERQYLFSAVQVLTNDAAVLHDEWANGFADEFANAGKQGSRYNSQLDAVQKIVEGMTGILDEVANGKITDPFDEQDVQLIESQFSRNSLTDFANNMRSVQNSYLGGYHNGTDGVGLNEFVATRNKDLDTRLQNEIQATITRISEIPEPFRNNRNATTQIQAAKVAMRKVMNTLDSELKSLLTVTKSSQNMKNDIITKNFKLQFAGIFLLVTALTFQPSKSETNETKETEQQNNQKIGVLLVNHGSRSETWRNALLQLEKNVTDSISKSVEVKGIKTAFMEYNEPSIATRLKEFDKDGFTDVIIVPIFLTVSPHSFDDIPTIIGKKDDPHSMEMLKLEKIERYKPKARTHITPLLDFTDILQKNVLRRTRALSQNPEKEGLVLIGYGDETYDKEWGELFNKVAEYVKLKTGINKHSYGWCGHIAHYNPEETTKAINNVLEEKESAVVIPVLVAHDEMFQIKIIGSGIAKVQNSKEKVLYKPDAILPDSNIENWVISIAKEYVKKIQTGDAS